MRAFPSPESLAEHYTSNHGAAGTNYLSPSDSNDELDTTLAQEQLLELRLTLEALFYSIGVDGKSLLNLFFEIAG